MFTALNPAEFSEVMSVNRHIPTAWETKSALEKAIALDIAGDKFKAEGKLESAKVCYSRAVFWASKAFK